MQENLESLLLKYSQKIIRATLKDLSPTNFRFFCYLSFGISDHAMPTSILPESVPFGVKILVKNAVD